MKAYFRPIIPLLAAYAAGIAISGIIFGHVGVRFFYYLFSAAALIAIFSLARVIVHIFKTTNACVSPLALMLALGILSMASWSPTFFPPDQAKFLIDGGSNRICGTISGALDARPGRVICVLDDLADRITGRPDIHLPGRIRVVLRGHPPDILPGDRILVFAKIRELKNFNNPGGFDYRRYMTFENIWGSMYADDAEIEVLSRAKRGRLKNRLERFRSNVETGIETACHNFPVGFIPHFNAVETAAVLSALTVGKKDRITPDLRDDFSRAGVSHLLAISGLHVGIVSAGAFFLFKWLFSFSYNLLSRGAAGRWAAVFSCLIVIFYAMISGMSPSTQRAVLMVMVFLCAFFIGRDYDLANTIAVAAFFILIRFPPAWFDVSFKLSFAAVCAIFYGFFVRPKRSVSDKTGFFNRAIACLGGFVYVSFCAIIGTAPLVMLYFNQLSVAGIFSNIILVPLIGFVVVSCGLLSVFIFAFFPAAGNVGFVICAAVLSPAISLSHAISRIPFASFKTITPSMVEIICFYVIVAAILFLVSNRKQENQDADRSFGATRRRRVALSGLAFALLVLCGDSFYWIHARFFHKDLRAAIIDVGQGSAALIEFPGGKCMLIDGGGFYGNSVFDVGKNIVAPYLWRRRILTLDTIVLSHPDADHLNGLVYVLKQFRVRRVITSGDLSDSLEYAEFKRIIGKKTILCPEFSAVSRTWRGYGADVRILYPPKTFVHARSGEREGDRNNHSIVVRVSYAGRSILFPGDIEASAEKTLIASAGNGLISNVLVSPHHGSRTSSTFAFLAAVRPETIIISTRGNRPGLPSKTVLARYEKQGYSVFRTDLNGAVRVSIDDAGMRITPTIYCSAGPSP